MSLNSSISLAKALVKRPLAQQLLVGSIAVLLTGMLPLSTQAADDQTAIVKSVGCGSGCAIYYEQLGLPTRMGNGWAKVRVRSTKRFRDPNGNETSFRGTPSGTQKTFWQFADCQGTSFGTGIKADASDAKLSEIGEISNGSFIKFTSNASGQIYTKWKKLCNATGLPTRY